MGIFVNAEVYVQRGIVYCIILKEKLSNEVFILFIYILS